MSTSYNFELCGGAYLISSSNVFLLICNGSNHPVSCPGGRVRLKISQNVGEIAL